MSFLFNSPLEQFEVAPLFNTSSSNLFEPTTFTFVLFLITFVVFFLLFNTQISSINTIVPNAFTIIVETIYDVAINLVQSNIGKQGNIYFPFIFSTFFFILTANLIGMFPFSFTVTSHISMTLGVASFIFIGINYIGVLKWKSDLLSLFLPSGSSLALAIMLVPIELLSYVFRVVSLSVRLFANMMAGHTLLKVIIGFFWIMVADSGILFLLSAIPILALILLIGLEFAVAVIQAFVFTILMCFYLNDAINLH